MSNKINESPYIKDINRLSDIIAAIQVMSTYRFYKLDFKNWSKRISGDEKSHLYWKNIFEQHPEFFRFNLTKDKASLAWRRSKQRRFHVDLNRELSLEELNNLGQEVKNNRVSRVPLSSSDINTLISTAIDLHTRAFENKKDERWWVLPVISVLSGLAGVTLGALLK